MSKPTKNGFDLTGLAFFPRPRDANAHTILPIGYEGLWNPTEDYVFNDQVMVFNHTIQLSAIMAVTLRVGLQSSRTEATRFYVSRAYSSVYVRGNKVSSIGLTTPRQGLGFLPMATDGTSWMKARLRTLGGTFPDEGKTCLSVLGGFFNYLGTFGVDAHQGGYMTSWEAMFEPQHVDWDSLLLRMISNPRTPVTYAQVQLAYGLSPTHEERKKVLRSVLADRAFRRVTRFEDLGDTFMCITEGDPAGSPLPAECDQQAYVGPNPYEGLACQLVLNLCTSPGVLVEDLELRPNVTQCGINNALRIISRVTVDHAITVPAWEALRELVPKLATGSWMQLPLPDGRFVLRLSFVTCDTDVLLGEIPKMSLDYLRLAERGLLDPGPDAASGTDHPWRW